MSVDNLFYLKWSVHDRVTSTVAIVETNLCLVIESNLIIVSLGFGRQQPE